MESEITCLAFNRETSQFASGSENGIVTIWNMGTGKVDNTLYDLPSKISLTNRQCKIVAMSFCGNYSCILVAQAVGILSVWGLKQAGSEYSGKSVFKLFHLDSESGPNLTGLRSMMTVYSSEMLFHKSFMPEEVIYKKENSVINFMAEAFKGCKRDIESIKVQNDFTLAELEEDSGILYFEKSPSLVRQNSRQEPRTREEYLYVLVGDEKGTMVTVDLLPVLKFVRFPGGAKTEAVYAAAPGGSDDPAKRVVDVNRAESIMALSQTKLFLNTISRRVTLRNCFPRRRGMRRVPVWV